MKQTHINWNDPAERLALIERVGVDEYTRQFEAYHRSRIVDRAGGRDIWPVDSGWGRIYAIEGLNRGFSKVEEAIRYAEENPKS